MDPQNPESDLIHHEEIYRGLIVNLFKDTVRLASGKPAVREVVRHPGGAVVVPVLGDGRIVLVRQFRYALGKYILELPAGKLDSRRNPLETVRLELEEEAGYAAREISHEFSFYSTPGISDEIIHLFVARDLDPVERRPEEGEHITVESYSAEECIERIATGEIADGKTILGILWYYLRQGQRRSGP